MVTKDDIETLAVQLADLDFEGMPETIIDEKIDAALIGLDDADERAVLERAAEISRERGQKLFEMVDKMNSLRRLAAAAGCPEDVPLIPWLQERGLIEQVDGGWRIKEPIPREFT